MRNEKSGCLKYVDGEVIFTEGSTGKEMYMILRGTVEVSQRVGERNESIAILRAGGFFGEMSPLIGKPRFATITAMGEVSLRAFSLDEMFHDMQTNEQFMKDVCFRLAERLRYTTSQLNIALLESHFTQEEDFRTTEINYLREVVQEKDNEIEELEKQLELTKRGRSLLRRR